MARLRDKERKVMPFAESWREDLEMDHVPVGDPARVDQNPVGPMQII